MDDVSRKTKTFPLEEATIFVAWEQIDAQRWMLADDYGRLYFLMLLRDGSDVTGWKLDLIGQVSRASVLVYLDDGLVFVGSHQGDSQVIRIRQESIEVVQTISNIAPIVDFTIMDMGSRVGDSQTNEYSTGQARIVTGSGAYQDGSLRSVRSGVGLEELGSLGEMNHITELFSIKSQGDGKFDTLVVSFVDETRIFTFTADGEVEETESFSGFDLSEGTLLASHILQGRLLQVTSNSVRISDSDNGMITAEWNPSSGLKIVAVSANTNHVALSLGGTELVILDLSRDLRVVSSKVFGEANQIACLALPSILSAICIVGFWQGLKVSILLIDDLEPVQVTNEFNAVPRSVLLCQIHAGQHPTLFVALADGNVVSYDFNKSDFSMMNRKSTILGTQQAKLRALPMENGYSNVFAMCEHPSLIYSSEGRLIFSAITAEKATCVCQFDSEAYPNSIVIATPEDLKLALVDTERTSHVQTLPMGETVRRIAYSTSEKVFGLGTIKRALKEGVEIVQSHFKLVDEIVFKELDTYELNEDELVESVIRGKLSEREEGSPERFIVGTAYLADDAPDTVRGRILVFEVTKDRVLRVVAEKSVKGACRALAVMKDKLVAALVKTVSRSSEPSLI